MGRRNRRNNQRGGGEASGKLPWKSIRYQVFKYQEYAPRALLLLAT
jgi:hypothetical protein